MHGRRQYEYEWRGGGGNRRRGGRSFFAEPSLVSSIVQTLRDDKRDYEACQVLLGKLRCLPHPGRGEGQPGWEQVPPVSRVVHEAARGTDGAFAELLPSSSSSPSAVDAISALVVGCGLEPDIADADGRTPLWIAAERCDVEAVRFLVEEGRVNADARDLGGWSPLHATIDAAIERKGDDARSLFPPAEQIVSILIEKGNADVNAMDHHGFTALHAAAESDRMDLVALLRRWGAEVDTPNEDGRTALHTVLGPSRFRRQKKHLDDDRLEAVKFLTCPPCNANVHARDDGGVTPFLVAVMRKKYDVMRYLAEEYGADVLTSNETRQTALHFAANDFCASGFDTVKYLLDKGADPSARSLDGETPLHYAMDNVGGRSTSEAEDEIGLDVARLLVKSYGADVNARDGFGRNPLSWVLGNGWRSRDQQRVVKCLDVLVGELGADTAAVDDRGDTYLHTVLAYGSRHEGNEQPVLQKLLGFDGTDINARNADGLTPLLTAVENRQAPLIVNFLHKCGASIDAEANDGRTPLHIAVANGNLELVKALVECGADPNRPTSDGLTSLGLAVLHCMQTHDSPDQHRYISADDLRSTWGPIAKFLLNDAGASPIPPWWTPARLVGRPLCNDSRRALEAFANGARRRPHVTAIVRAQRALEGATAYGPDIDRTVQQRIGGGDLAGATKVLVGAMVEEVSKGAVAAMEAAAENDVNLCPICFGPLHDDDENNSEGSNDIDVSSNDNSDGREEPAEDSMPEKKDEEEKSSVKMAPATTTKTQLVCCPNHHAMHAGCLTDLFLGGNFRCPVCRARFPVGADLDLRSLAEERRPEGRLATIEGDKTRDSLFPWRPQTVDETVSAVEQRARELRGEELGGGGVNEGGDVRSDDIDNENLSDIEKQTVTRAHLVRARDELLRSGEIDGTLLVRGGAALRATWFESRGALGIVAGGNSPDAAGGNSEDDVTEGESRPDDTGQDAIATARPVICASVGFGRGLLDPLVQQSMLTGELVRAKQARKVAHRRLEQLKLGDGQVEQEDEADVEQIEDDFEGREMLGSGGLRRMQAEMRKRRAKQERRLCGLDLASASLALPQRELSDQSRQAVAILEKRGGESSSNGSAIADASRGHRYLELAAPTISSIAQQSNHVDPMSKAALREAVASGEVDSAARHLRRGRIVAKLQHAGEGALIESPRGGDEHRAGSTTRGTTKKQRKHLAALRRHTAMRREADAIGCPICCYCHQMIASASSRPPCTDTDQSTLLRLAAESLSERHASCVNGHTLHTTCFLQLVTEAKPCPTCAEPLVAPPIVSFGNEEDDCGGGHGGGGAVEDDAQLFARLDYMSMCCLLFDDEDEFGRLQREEGGEFGGGDPLSDLRQCPSCKKGPLCNEYCSDLNTHHGECQRCQTRLCSRQDLNQRVKDHLQKQRDTFNKEIKQLEKEGTGDDEEKGTLSVLEAVPNCKACQSQGLISKVWYNGCMSCGMSFTATPWDSLPPFEPPPEMYGTSNEDAVRLPRRLAYLERVRRERRAARSVAALAEQLQDELVALLHDKKALADEMRRRATSKR